MRSLALTILTVFLFIWGWSIHNPSINTSENEVVSEELETPITTIEPETDEFQLDTTESNITITELKDTHVVQEGEKCGGATGSDCHPSLYCQINPEAADLSGVCIDTVVDKTVVCPKANQPVCGMRDGHKFGYASRCEARRHGAVILNEGFCKKDTAAVGSCEHSLVGIGRCSDFFTGVQYNSESNTCTRVSTVACSADIPFVTEDECVLACK